MNNENQILDELIVSTLEDENDGDFSQGDLSLREAIAQAESGDTITFDPNLSDGTIVLTSDDLIIDKSLTIKGLGADRLTIDAGEDNITEFEPYSDGVRVFNVDDGNSDTLADVTISGLTITGGNTGGFVSGGNTINDRGGGIFNTENLEIDGSVIRDNQAISYGGGIYNEGMLTITSSAIDNNSVATATPSLIGTDGGGIYNRGTAKVENSTVTNNIGTRGGGISSAGELNIANSTIAGNSGIDREGTAEPDNKANGAGIFGADDRITITSSIIANNKTDISDVDFRTIDPDADVSIEIISNGNNLIGNADNVNGLVDSDLAGTADAPIDPQLGELQNNGGATPTQALLDGSPAINAGSNPNELATDQRGEGFDRTIGEATDIGAFEVQSNDPGGADNDNTIATANDSGISPDGQQNVVINDDVSFNSDVDLFKLELEAKDVATFNIEASEIGSSLDSVVRVFDADGNALALDDDSDAPFEPSSLDSYFEYQPKTNGVYYVGVSSYSNFDYDPVNGGDSEGFSSGDYDLAISVFNNVDGTDSADNLNGTAEADLMEGFGGNDRLIGGRSNDRLLGAGGNDALYGGDGDDLLQGEAGFDVLRGGNGNDTLGGGVGQNKLFGGNGNDVLAIGQGEDVINDFQDSEDKLLLTGDLELLVFEDLTIFDTGRDVITISLNDTTYATLTGVSAEQITADDFVSSDFLSSNSIADDRAEIIAK